VYGAHAGEGASRQAAAMPDNFRAEPLGNPPMTDSGELLDVSDIRNSLKSLMWRAAGVRRSGDQLAEAAENIDRWCRYVLPRQFADPAGWELQNMLTNARLMIAAALAREETRGVHLRTDFPAQDNLHWKRRITLCRNSSDDVRSKSFPAA
jgi:L-aspartate oxidase